MLLALVSVAEHRLHLDVDLIGLLPVIQAAPHLFLQVASAVFDHVALLARHDAHLVVALRFPPLLVLPPFLPVLLEVLQGLFGVGGVNRHVKGGPIVLVLLGLVVARVVGLLVIGCRRGHMLGLTLRQDALALLVGDSLGISAPHEAAAGAVVHEAS